MRLLGNKISTRKGLLRLSISILIAFAVFSFVGCGSSSSPMGGGSDGSGLELIAKGVTRDANTGEVLPDVTVSYKEDPSYVTTTDSAGQFDLTVFHQLDSDFTLEFEYEKDDSNIAVAALELGTVESNVAQIITDIEIDRENDTIDANIDVVLRDNSAEDRSTDLQAPEHESIDDDIDTAFNDREDGDNENGESGSEGYTAPSYEEIGLFNDSNNSGDSDSTNNVLDDIKKNGLGLD